jgi:Rrf2 family protein
MENTQTVVPSLINLSPGTVRALALLAELSRKPRVGLSQLSARTGLPLKRTEQLVGALRRAGLVTSVVGRHGGVSLARPLAEISALDVIAALEPQAQEKHFEDWLSGATDAARISAVRLAARMHETLGAMSISDLIAA